MKELTTEQRAKRYVQALDRAKKWYNAPNIDKMPTYGSRIIEEIFPELKESESEDERIRKEIYWFFTQPDTVCDKRWISWLEKQGRKKPVISDGALREGIAHFGITQYQIDNWLKKYVDVEKQDEQKPIIEMKSPEESLGVSSKEYNDIVNECLYGKSKFSVKTEPKLKFHEGDWIISDTVNEDYHICKVTGIKDGHYIIESIYGYKGYNQFDVFDNAYRLWTIQDAKDGDILQLGLVTAIFREIVDTNHCKCYCSVCNGKFGTRVDNTYGCYNAVPANKEQSDTLMKAIADIGWEFDFEKKELKKIEPKFDDKVKPKFKVKYAGSEYNVFETKDIAGVTFYGIEDEPNHIDYVKAENCEIIDGYGIKKNGCSFPTKPIMFSEHKPANKIEPKFKVGDWVIDKQGIVHQIANVIENVTNHTYGYDIVGGGYFNDNTEGVRLWTIADVKDGDVLCSEQIILLFKKWEYNSDWNCVIAYAGIDITGKLQITNEHWLISNHTHPATKEQRDTLFAKMKEAGYEWDANKLELYKKPKFKVGEWVTDGQLTCKVLSVTGKSYELHLYNDDYCHFETDVQSVDKHYHLWTIQDTHDGDVLTSIGFHSNCTFIFKGLDNWKFDEPNGDRAVATGYCCLSVSSDKMEFGIQGPDCVEVNTIKPATKIQRDLLFQKIKESGYEWDAEKKELRKIENEIPFGAKDSELHEVSYYIPEGYYAEIDDDGVIIKKGKKPAAWSGEDNTYYDDICEILINLIHSDTAKVNKDVVQRDLNWFTSLINRVQPQPKQEWDKEDERMYRGLYNLIYFTPYCDSRKKLSDWLKSLKQRIIK